MQAIVTASGSDKLNSAALGLWDEFPGRIGRP